MTLNDPEFADLPTTGALTLTDFLLARLAEDEMVTA